MGLLDRITGRTQLFEEIDQLRREVRRLRKQTSALQGIRSIAGLKEKVIQLDAELKIQYINSTLATELGIDRARATGRPLSSIDSFSFGPGLLTSMCARALETSGTVKEDRQFEDDGGREHFLEISVDPGGGSPQILIEDVTSLRSLEEMFARYVSPEVIKKMQSLPGKDFFRAERHELTVLFADLRGFTSVAEKMPPDTVRTTLNQFLTRTINVIDRHEACVDKVIADEVMALFGAPIPYADHASRALRAAVEMQADHAQLMEQWTLAGQPAIPMGIGLNSGEMIVGNIGSAKRMDYTAIGHNVNVASRLCSLAQAGEILITRETFEVVRNNNPRLLDGLSVAPGAREIQAKGISRPVEVVSIRLPAGFPGGRDLAPAGARG